MISCKVAKDSENDFVSCVFAAWRLLCVNYFPGSGLSGLEDGTTDD